MYDQATQRVETCDSRSYEWPKPQTLADDLSPVPDFNPALLLEAFREHVCDVAQLMQVPQDLPAVYAGACLAGVVNRRAIIQPRCIDETWQVVGNLWALCVAPSGKLKTLTQTTFTRHLQRASTYLANQ